MFLTVPFQDTDDLSSQVVQLQPKQEVRGHPLGPATLVLSAHQLWLASIGRDGLLRVRETSSMVGSYACRIIPSLSVVVPLTLLRLQEQYMELQCHSRRLGGGRSVSFSADSQTLITVGSRDGSVVCTHVRWDEEHVELCNAQPAEGTVALSSGDALALPVKFQYLSFLLAGTGTIVNKSN